MGVLATPQASSSVIASKSGSFLGNDSPCTIWLSYSLSNVMRATNAIRVDWSLSVSARCQQCVTDLRGLDAAGFERLFKRLSDDLPVPATVAERVFLRDRLRVFAELGGRRFDEAFHECTGSRLCHGDACAAGMTVWSAACTTANPAHLLREWASIYASRFAREHVWPLGWRAAALLQCDPRQPLNLDHLAKTLACSRSVLTRAFRNQFGQSVGQFHATVRVHHAIELLTKTNWSVDAVAHAAGYHSPNNLYIALRRMTGLTPGRVRAQISAFEAEFQARSLLTQLFLGAAAFASPSGPV